jgi:hypothetical protein
MLKINRNQRSFGAKSNDVWAISEDLGGNTKSIENGRGTEVRERGGRLVRWEAACPSLMALSPPTTSTDQYVLWPFEKSNLCTSLLHREFGA